jgi:hypothetical protein
MESGLAAGVSPHEVEVGRQGMTAAMESGVGGRRQASAVCA